MDAVTSNPIMLACTDLSAGYHGRDVLRGVSLALPRGSITAILGPNGSGKTTLLRALTGSLPPGRGEVLLEGLPLARLAPPARARRLACVPQTVGVAAPFLVRDLVTLGRTAHRSLWTGPSRADDEAVAAALADMDIERHASTPFPLLSAGEQQRALLAVALAQQAPVLLLDEPTAHLDIRHAWSLLRQVVSLAETRGTTVLFTTHDLHLAEAFATQVALMDQGRIVAMGAPANVLTAELLSSVFGHPVEVADVNGRRWIQPQRT